MFGHLVGFAGRYVLLKSPCGCRAHICFNSQVLTGILPFETETDVSAVLRIIEGHLPTIHGDARIDHVVALASVMSDCWNLDPEKRPKAKVCKDEISHMVRITATSCWVFPSEVSCLFRSAWLRVSEALVETTKAPTPDFTSHWQMGTLETPIGTKLLSISITRSVSRTSPRIPWPTLIPATPWVKCTR